MFIKKAFYLGLIIFSIVFSSCEKDEDFEKKLLPPLELPETVNYDLNNDLIDDIAVFYNRFWRSSSPYSEFYGEGIEGNIKPYNNCLILKLDGSYSLFSEPGDLISKEQLYPYSWEPFPFYGYTSEIDVFWEVVSIYSDYDEEAWPDEWRIESDLDLDYYYMGIRITDEDSDQIGWIKLDIDRSTGIIDIIDKQFTTDDSIVIEE